MTTIRETVQDHIPVGYMSDAEAAIRSLEQREETIVNQCVQFAVEVGGNGVEVSEVRNFLVNTLGLYVTPAPEPTPEIEEPPAGTSINDDRLDRLESQVTRLIELAESRLGVNI